MTSRTSIPIFLAHPEGATPGHLRSAIDASRRPGDELIETESGELPKVIQARLRDDQSALVFMTADDPDHLGIARRAQRAGPTNRVYTVILLDADAEDLQEEVSASRLNTWIARGSDEETADSVRDATQAALGLVKR